MKLRLSAELRDKISEIAKQNGRSMNSEIIARLESSFDPNIHNMDWLDAIRLLQGIAEEKGVPVTITIGSEIAEK